MQSLKWSGSFEQLSVRLKSDTEDNVPATLDDHSLTIPWQKPPSKRRRDARHAQRARGLAAAADIENGRRQFARAATEVFAGLACVGRRVAHRDSSARRELVST